MHTFQDACASLCLAGELVLVEDLVLHDARMDIRSPTHELARAHAALQARRLIASAAPAWPLSAAGLAALRDGERWIAEVEAGAALGDEAAEDKTGNASDDPLAAELAALDHALERSNHILADGAGSAKRPRDPLLYDPDPADGAGLEAWRRAAAATASDPPILAAALLWDAWETHPPLERQGWLGNLPVPANLRAQQKTRAHLFCLNSALRLVRREKRRSPERTTRLIAFLEATVTGAEAGLQEHDRWLLARRRLEGKLKGRRSTSRLPALVDLVLARPIVSAGMIAR
jgi:hypothetical protein